MISIHSPTYTYFSDKQVMNLINEKQGNKMQYLVTCEGACENVKIKLEVESGDPDLFALDYSQPSLNDNQYCSACSSFCSSRRGTSESCEISTTRSSFYVLVYAISDYGSGRITFENVLNVEQYGKCLLSK